MKIEARTFQAIYKKVHANMRLLEQTSLVGLTIFSAYKRPRLFAPFFGAGVVLGVQGDKKCHLCHEHPNIEVRGCSQGFLEQLSRVKLPGLLGLAANVAIAACHIDHHSTVFVPLAGLSGGAWGGRLIVESTTQGDR